MHKIVDLIESKLKAIIAIIVSLMVIVGVVAVGAGLAARNEYKNSEEYYIQGLLNSRKASSESGEDIDFNVFFLRDTDGDGYAESFSEIDRSFATEQQSKTDSSKVEPMFLELNVKTQGKLKNAKVTITDSNFKWKTAIISDNIIKKDYIGYTDEIEFNDMTNGTQVLVYGTIESLISNNINDYGKESTITLTGTFVDDDENEFIINKEQKLKVNWNGVTSTYIHSPNSQSYDIDNAIKPRKIQSDFYIEVWENSYQLLMNKQEVELEIPQLNGYDPIGVTCTSANVKQQYDAETRKLVVTRQATVNEKGIITRSVSRQNIYNFTVEYPISAYDTLGMESFLLNVNYTAKNYGYNNSKYTNPYVSSVNSSLSLYYRKATPSQPIKVDTWNFYTKIGKYTKRYNDSYYTYRISKEGVQNIYNGNIYDDIEDTYPEVWEIRIGDYTKIDKITVEDSDYNKFNNSISMENLVTTSGIYFGNPDIFGDDGKIKLYDENDNLIETFTKENWGEYTSSAPYKTNLKKIKIVTTSPQNNYSFYVYQIKELNDEAIANKYTENEFYNINTIYKYSTATVKSTAGTTFENGSDEWSYSRTENADYDYPYSIANVDLNKFEIANQKTENIKLTISTYAGNFLEKSWKNGKFLVELPSEIMDVEIKDIKASDNKVKILQYFVFEENGKKLVRIDTQNEEECLYSITLDLDVAGNPLYSTKSVPIKLYAYNDNCDNYLYKTSDIYDLDGDLLNTDSIGYRTVPLKLISSQGLITAEYITDYDDLGSITIAPNVAEIDRSDEARTAKVNISIANNYSETISEMKILGKVPFEGNKYILTDSDLGSQYTTHMKNAITVPDVLQTYTTVYYSENENPTEDINDSSNGWTQNVSDFSSIKSYLIDLGDYILTNDGNKVFSYDVEVPANVGYNKLAFTTHAVYYTLDTTAGKFKTQTQPNKVGMQVVGRYNLDAVKNKATFSNILVSGATYKLETRDAIDKEIVKTAITDADGKIKFNRLIIGREYLLKEIASPNDYALNENGIKFTTSVEELNGEQILNIETLDGEFCDVPQISIDDNSNYLVSARVEDEGKYKLIINTQDDAGNPLTNLKYSIMGKENSRLYKDVNGRIEISGLYVDEEYQLQELKSEGYYIDITPRTFKIVRDEDTNVLKIETEDEELASSIIVEEIPGQSTVTVTIVNKKIPTYNLQILKIEDFEIDDETDENDVEYITLSNAKFKIVSDDLLSTNIYETDEDGKISIEGLYNYVEGKYISGRYTLQEINAPEGYANDAEEIEFFVEKDFQDNLLLEIKDQDSLRTIYKAEIDGDTLQIIIKDKPLFKLTKVDSETGNPLANAKFIIYEIDDNKEIIDYAKDVNGDYVGEKDENGDYIVTTDETGTIKIPLRGGTYLIKEVGYPDGYLKDSNQQIFKVSGETEDENTETEKVDLDDIEEIYYIEDLVKLSNQVKLGKSYANQTIKLMRTLDFKDAGSYRSGKVDVNLISKSGFEPIGSENYSFEGIFDGQDFEIKNLYVNNKYQYAGLFGYAKHNSTIKNLGVTGFLNSSKYIGGVVAKTDGTIDKCHAELNLIDNTNISGMFIGGIAGFARTVTNSYNTCDFAVAKSDVSYTSFIGGIAGNAYIVSNCYNEGNISGNMYTGGIVGYTENSLNNCYNTGNIYGFQEVGGITGRLSNNSGSINNCYNEGEISGDNYVGGIVGTLYSSTSENVTNVSKCYNKGKVYGGKLAGGIVGSFLGKIQGCYNEAVIEGADYVGGIVGGTNYESSYDTGSIILECYNKGIVIGSLNDAGGIVGYANNGKISCCYNEGDVNNVYNRAGGIAGKIYNRSIVSNCYNKGFISSQESSAGGIIGYSENESQISNCYNVANVISENGYAGGIAGYIDDSTIKNCYYWNQIDIFGDTPDFDGISKSEQEMKDASFIYELGTVCWDLDVDNVNEGFPVLNNSEEDEDVEIYYIEDLNDLSFQVNGLKNTYHQKNIKLMRTLDFEDNNSYKSGTVDSTLISGSGFSPIGCSNYIYFEGIFDGQGYEINNYYINSKNSTLGLFGYIQNAEIKNLGVKGNIICNYEYNGSAIAGLVGYAKSSTIDNCYNKGKISNDRGTAAGIVGNSYYSNITNCYNIGKISATENSAGIVASSVNGSITNCYNSAEINVLNEYNYGSSNYNYYRIYVGGIIGLLNSTKITNSYNTGKIVGNNSSYNNDSVNHISYTYVGGIAGGENPYSSNSNALIKNCYNTGELRGNNTCSQSGETYVGGIDGYMHSSNTTIENCYNVGKVVSVSASNDSEAGRVASGWYTESNIKNSYYSINVDCIGTDISSSGLPRTEQEMKERLFVYQLGTNGWKYDEENINNGFPILGNQNVDEWEDILEINYIEDLVELSNQVNLGKSYEGKTIKLLRDLDFTETSSYRNLEIDNSLINDIGFISIGINSESAFKGIFDGQDFEISNLYIKEKNQNVGLFGYTDHAEIKNIKVSGKIDYDDNVRFTADTRNIYTYVGGIVGYANKTNVINCGNNLTINVTNSDENLNIRCCAGGIVGYENGGKIEESYNLGIIKYLSEDIYNYICVGGIRGDGNGDISNSYNTGEIAGSYVGGISGKGSGNISNCYNEGEITGKYVGGISGEGTGKISNCYNEGTLVNSSNSSNVYLGGIIGIGSASVIESYNDSRILLDGNINTYTNGYIGGICGKSSGNIKNCYNKGNISASTNSGISNNDLEIGGIVGRISGSINNCYNIGEITGNAEETRNVSGKVAGIVGNSKGCTIKNCYNIGNVTLYGTSNRLDCSGGIVGYADGVSDYITNCYNIGNVINSPNFSSSLHKVGAIVAYINSSCVYNCYYLETIELTGTNDNLEGEAKTDVVMKSAEFIDDLNSNVWALDEDLINNGYPILVDEYEQEPIMDDFEEILEIYYIEDLAELSRQVNLGKSYKNKQIKLMRNLDFKDANSYKSGEVNGELSNMDGFAPIGINEENCFEGDFDGQNFKIANIKMSSNITNKGLFGYIKDSKIENLGISGNFTEGKNVGGIVGVCSGTCLIDSCYNEVKIVSNSSSSSTTAGGIVCILNSESIVSNCYNIGSIGAQYSSVAGIVYDNEGTINNCYNSGDFNINSTYYAAGIAVINNGTITNCYNTEKIAPSYSYNTAGIAITNNGEISNCYNTGEIWAYRTASAGIASTNNGTISDCYNNGIITGSAGGGISASNTGTIINCKNSESIGYSTASSSSTGGISGSSSGTIKYCFNEATVSGGIVGGIVGSNSGKITFSYNLGTIKSKYYNGNAGGLVGKLSGTITNCYNKGDLIANITESYGSGKVGGLVGLIENNALLSNCYNLGGVSLEHITEQSIAGPIYGSNLGNMDNCYFLNTINVISENQNTDGLAKTDQEMKSEAFIYQLGWHSWKIDEGNINDGYPIFDLTEEFEDITEINCIEDLKELSYQVNMGKSYENKTIKLMKSLDFENENSYKCGVIDDGLISELGFHPIGANGSYSFKGKFEGQGYEIKNLYINSSDCYVGLFGYLDGATINDLSVTGEIRLSGRSNTSNKDFCAGGIAGYADSESTIKNCNYNGELHGNEKNNYNSYKYCLGGIVGYISGTIENCYNLSSIDIKNYGVYYLGGVAGYIEKNSYVSGCYNKGALIDNSTNYYTNQYIGGIAGYIEENTPIQDCYNDGKINYLVKNSYLRLGGIAGYTINNTIINCHNTGEIYGYGKVGGIAGELIGAVLDSCYNTGDIKNGSNIGGLAGYANCIEVKNCYNTGSLTYDSDNNNNNNNNTQIGGLIGVLYNSKIIDSNSSGELSGYTIGGICGSLSQSNISNCSNTGKMTGYYVGGIIGTASESNVNTCFNVAELHGTINGGIIGNASICEVNNSYNTGNMSSESSESRDNNIGGITGNASQTDINNCFNTGDITGNYLLGGISGVYSNSGKMNCCYNTGNIKGKDYSRIGGIAGYTYNSVICDVYNRGEINGNYTQGGLVGSLGSGILENGYNTGNIICSRTDNYYSYSGGVVGDTNYSNGIARNCYYSNTITIEGKNINNLGGEVTEVEMTTMDFYTTLNVNEVWKYNFGDYPTLAIMDLLSDANVTESTELRIENTIRKFVITTEVENLVGGTVSGQNDDFYETIRFGEDSTKEIVFTPDLGYQITKIKINDQELGFLPNEDGTFTIPSGYFTNMQESKHISVSFTANDQVLIINKVAEDDSNKVLQGAKFAICDELREEVKDEVKTIENNGTYYFEEIDGKYVSNNQSKHSTTANSYIPIDLTNNTGKYNLIVNAQISSQGGYDMGYATVSETTSAPAYNNSEGRFIYISGTQNAKDYTTVLEAGKMYYLHLGYYKNSYTNYGTDTFTVNSVKLELNQDDMYYEEVVTNEYGQARVSIPGDARVSINELEAPDGYTLNATEVIHSMTPGVDNEVTVTNKEQTMLTIHHYLKGTTNKVAEDEILKGDIGEEYKTSPRTDLEKLVIAKDEQGVWTVPENASGIYGENAIEVSYFYEAEPIILTIHHYYEGTEDKYKPDETIETIPSVVFDEDGKYSISTTDLQEYSLKDNDVYNSLPEEIELIYIKTTIKDEVDIEDVLEYNEDSEITYYYRAREYEYKIHYYYDGIEDESAFESEMGEFGRTIEFDEKDKKGYKFERAENNPLIISSNVDNNVINVYYVIDETQTKDLSYTVEYYKDGILVREDLQKEIVTVQCLQPNIVTVNKDNINIVDKYIGYKLDTENTKPIPDEVNNREAIKVYYILDESQVKDVSYTIEYYKDGNLEETEIKEFTVHVLDEKLPVDKEALDNKYYGAMIDTALTGNIPDMVDIGATLKIYYKVREYIVTTEIAKNANGSREGGSITGSFGYYNNTHYQYEDNIRFVEMVKHEENATKDIVITPYNGWDVLSITINGEAYDYTIENNKVIIPKFDNVTQDYHIVVRFGFLSRTLKIEKEDREGNRLKDAKFEITSDDYVNATTYISSLKSYNSDYYSFSEQDDYTFISTNHSNNTASVSYIVVDMNSLSDDYNLVINAKISSEENCDYGYVIVSEEEIGAATSTGTGTGTSSSYDSYSSSSYYNQFDSYSTMFRISGEVDSQDYSQTLYGGRTYYVYFVYAKDSSSSRGNDRFTINNVELIKGQKVTTVTDENGESYVELQRTGEYTVKEIETPEHYILSEEERAFELVSSNTLKVEKFINDRKPIVIVHHYFKDGDGNYTNNKVAEDEVLEGNPGERYSTNPYNLSGLKIENVNGNNVIPSNASGEYPGANESLEVNYYYEISPVKLTIHHYKLGTNESIVDDEIVNKLFEVSFYDNTYTIKSTLSYDLRENDNYATISDLYNLIKITNNSDSNSNLDVEEPLIYNSDTEITYYYKEKTYSYTIYYKEQNTDTEIAPRKEVGDNKLGSIVDENAIDIEGFYKVTNATSIEITRDVNEYTFYYTRRNDLTYRINYINKETGEEICDAKVVNNGIYKNVINAQDEIIVVPNLKFHSSDKENIVLELDDTNNEITLYYAPAYSISTFTNEHTESYRDGTTSSGVTGGTISGQSEDVYESVLSGDDATKNIVITPNEGYQIVRVTITVGEESEDLDIDSYLDSNGKTITIIPEEDDRLQGVTSDISIEAEFRKQSTVTVKYLDKETQAEITSPFVINGLESRPFEVTIPQILGYRRARVSLGSTTEEPPVYLTEVNGESQYTEMTEENNTISADSTILIYWYEPIPEGTILVRHIEVDESDINGTYNLESGTEISVEEIASLEEYVGQVGTTRATSRKEFTDSETGRTYISVDGPVSNDENIVVLDKDTNEYTVTIEERDLDDDGFMDIQEIRYYYERQYEITVKDKSDEGMVSGLDITIDGGHYGIISGDGENAYEIVNRMGSNTKIIEAVPNENYIVKLIKVNGLAINITDLTDENGKVTIPAGYFTNIVEDIEVEVFFEKAPGKVIVRYVDKETNEELDKTIIVGKVDDEYETESKEIEGYELDESSLPENTKGPMTVEDIEVVYYYKKVEKEEPIENPDKPETPQEPEKPEDEEPEIPQEPETIYENGGEVLPEETPIIEEGEGGKEPDITIEYTNTGSKSQTARRYNNVKTGDNIIQYVVTLAVSAVVGILTAIKKFLKNGDNK